MVFSARFCYNIHDMEKVEDYELLDSGEGRKLERFGGVTLARPCSQALWRPASPAAWADATASFDREDGNRWHGRKSLPKDWTITTAGIRFRLSGTDFGHLGIFPEQRAQWTWIREMVEKAVKDGKTVKVLNLFAYSGGSTIAAAQGGAEVCHLDAAKGMVQWARDNAEPNGLQTIRYAGSPTTPTSSLDARYGADIATTRSSSTLPPLGEARTARRTRSKGTCRQRLVWCGMSFLTIRSSCCSRRTRRAFRAGWRRTSSARRSRGRGWSRARCFWKGAASSAPRVFSAAPFFDIISVHGVHL